MYCVGAQCRREVLSFFLSILMENSFYFPIVLYSVKKVQWIDYIKSMRLIKDFFSFFLKKICVCYIIFCLVWMAIGLFLFPYIKDVIHNRILFRVIWDFIVKNIIWISVTYFK